MSITKITSARVRSYLPPRKKTAHKGDAGRVLIVAGSRGMIGAAVLSAMGAVRSGAGLTRAAMVKSQQNNFVKRAPLEVTTVGLPEDASGQLASAAWPQIRRVIRQFRPHVIAMGPGLGTGVGVRKVLDALLKNFRGGLVLDADALNVLAKSKSKKFVSPVVMTPHAGELGRLLNWRAKKISANRMRAVTRASELFGCVCLLKGHGTLISGGGRIGRNATGNPAMASGGMGDVLTGMIAAIWAQRPEQSLASGWEAACAGAYLHGKAADEAVKRFPEKTLLASDLTDVLPKVFKTVFRRSGS